MSKTMSKAAVLAVMVIVSIPLGLWAQDEGFYPYSFARLSYVNGAVYVQRTSDLGYEKGEVNLALVQGDTMGTESGQAEIHFGRRNYLRLDAYTKVEFAVLPSEGDERISLHIIQGSAYFRVSQLVAGKGIEVHTPDASFYVLEEGLYRFEVVLDEMTEAMVREGSLEAATEDGSVLVRANEAVTAADGRLLDDPRYDAGRGDAFENWNDTRDDLLAARSSRQYLPSEIEEYEEELDQYGSWVYERGYGNVWVPDVSYGDWRPYLYGRWVWYPVIGWTWVSSEPWGWSVYHYGRWHWRFGLGWYWIPQSHWGPAWVHWWWGHDHIGWCPLSWYNRPVLLVDNHFYDRYYDRYYSPHNRAMTVVRRDQLQARDVHRRELGVAERGRLDKVEFRAEQPSIRPAVDNARPQALAAKRALSVRPGSRTEVKPVAPSSSLAPSRMRPAASVSSPDRGAISRPSVRGSDPGAGSVRSYPSRRTSADRDEPGRSGTRGSDTASRAVRSSSGRDESSAPSATRRDGSGSTVRGGGAETGSNSGRISRPEGKTAQPAQPKAVRDPQATRTDGKGSVRSESSSGRSQSRSPSSRGAVSRAPSRLSASAANTARSYATVSRPSAPVRSSSPSSSRSVSSPRSSSSRSGSSSSAPSRSTSPSYSRSSPSRAPSSSRPRSSYAAPSRSSGSSGRAMSAPRPSSSSSGRSYSAPRSTGSSGRAVSAPRSSGSSGSARPGSSGRSGSSSSKSSGSSSKSGSVKRKG
jgi:hypothetical protein